MEKAVSDSQVLLEPVRRRGTVPPLSRLVEERRSTSHIPNPLLDSKIYAKLKSNSLIEAEPPELHFGGFELGKGYTKTLKIINISSEAMTVHIIPTQTKHFVTTYTKKYRLIPGLAYIVKVRFNPDEWRYFTDSVRIHCQGEENLLIPVYAYPVIDDLHIPHHIHLSPVPLGQSVSHAIPLRCSCPVEFEFQVFVIQPHEAFSISPLSGMIPARGEVNITVTFSPLQYETSEVTIQLIISQFNSKPYLCTITGSSPPYLSCCELGRKPGFQDAVFAGVGFPSPATKLPPISKKQHTSKDIEKSKIKEAQILKKVQLNLKDQAILHKGEICDSELPVSEKTRRKISEEGETMLKENLMVTRRMKTSHPEISAPEETSEHRIPLDKFFPFSFPVHNEDDDLMAHRDLEELPVRRMDVTVTEHVPLFSPEVPQRYKLMGYQPVSAWDAYNSYIPTCLARPLRSAPPDKSVKDYSEATSITGDEQQDANKEERVSLEDLTFTAPESLLTPLPANPLRIFNPAPGLRCYKPAPKYLETDLDFHLSPFPRYPAAEEAAEDKTGDTRNQTGNRTTLFPDLMTWKSFDLITHTCQSHQPAVHCASQLNRNVDYNTDILPTEAPPLLAGPSHDFEPLKAKSHPTVALTPEMIQAEFLPQKASLGEELQVEPVCRLEFNQMGRRVMTRLQEFEDIKTTSPPEEEDGKKIPAHSQKQASL